MRPLVDSEQAYYKVGRALTNGKPEHPVLEGNAGASGRLYGMQQPLREEWQVRSPKHRAFGEFEFVDLPFNWFVAPFTMD